MSHATAMLSILPSALFLRLSKIADLLLEFEKAVVAFPREGAGCQGFQHQALLLLRVRAVSKMAAPGERFDIGKGLLQPLTRHPDVKLPHARRINHHAALGQEDHLAPRSGVPALGVVRPHFHGGLNVLAIEAIDEAGLSHPRGADEHHGLARQNQFCQLLHSSSRKCAGGEHQGLPRHTGRVCQLGVEIVAEVNFVEDDDWAGAAFVDHDEHPLQSRSIEAGIGRRHEEGGVDVGGEDLHLYIAPSHLPRELGTPGEDGLDDSLLLIGDEFDSNPVTDLGELGLGPARFMQSFAGDLGGDFGLSRPNAVKVFVLHGNPTGNPARRKVDGELVFEGGVPPEFGQGHKPRIGLITEMARGIAFSTIQVRPNHRRK